MNTFATGSLPVHFSVAKLFNFRWQYTHKDESRYQNGPYFIAIGCDIIALMPTSTLWIAVNNSALIFLSK